MIRLNIATIATFALATSSLSHAQGLQGAMEQAMRTNPEVLGAEKNQSAISHRVRQAQAGYLPTLDLTAGTGYEKSLNQSTRFRPGRGNDNSGSRDLWRSESRLIARQMVFDGWATKSRVAQEKNRFTSAVYNVADIKNQTALAAAEAYLDVLRTREQVALTEQNVSVHQDYLSRIQARVGGGRSSQADIRQVEGRLNLAQANVESAKSDVKQAEARYLQVVGEMPGNLSKDATPFASLPADTQAAIARAMANSPVIASAMADIKAANAALAETKSVFCPRLEIEAGASRNRNLDGIQGLNNDEYAMLMLRQNLYRGGADVAQRKERMEIVKQAQDMLEKERREVETSVIDSMARIESAKNRLTPLSNHVEAAMSTQTAYSAQFDLGQRTLLDVLDSEVELFNSKSALIDAKYEVDAAAYAVLAHMGDLAPATTSTQANQIASQ